MAKSGARRQSPLAPGGIAHNIESEPELKGDSMADPTNSTDAQRSRSDGDNWPGIPLVGVGIVIVGAVFLARNFGWDFPLPDRWWAIFILIPAAAALVSAARYYRVDGRFEPGHRIGDGGRADARHGADPVPRSRLGTGLADHGDHCRPRHPVAGHGAPMT